MEIQLKIPLRPIPHQSVKMGRGGRTYQPKKILDYKTKIQEAVREQLPSGFSCFSADSNIHITKLHYLFEYTKSMPKYKRTGLVPKNSRPDLHDNLNKALFDALEGLVWERDQNVVAMDNVRKYYASEDAIIINIQCLSY